MVSARDSRSLALALLYVDIGLAHVSFPSSTRAHPSYHVYVDLNTPVRVIQESHSALFPITFHWEIWEHIAVPLMKDSDWRQHLPSASSLNTLLLKLDVEQVLDALEDKIKKVSHTP